MTNVTPASATDSMSIWMLAPISCVMEVMSCMTLWFSDCPNVSTSLVTRLMTSPVLTRSK